MTLKQLAAKAFDEGQRIRLTAVPLMEKEKKMNTKNKQLPSWQYADLKAKYLDLQSVNVSLSQANEELQKALQEVGAKHNAELTELYMKRRDLEVRIEGMVAEVKGARAEAELVKNANAELANKVSSLLKTLNEHSKIMNRLDDDNNSLERRLTKAQQERDTYSRLLKIIKATANGMTLEGEDRVSGVGEGLNG